MRMQAGGRRPFGNSGVHRVRDEQESIRTGTERSEMSRESNDTIEGKNVIVFW